MILATLKVDSTECYLMAPSDLNRVALPPLQEVRELFWQPWEAVVAGASVAHRHLGVGKWRAVCGDLLTVTLSVWDSSL